MENREDGKKIWHWVKIPKDRDIFINLICKKCEQFIDEGSFFYFNLDSPKIYCTSCGQELQKSGEYLRKKKINEISKELIFKIMKEKKASKFIFGRSLFVNFAIEIRNYRDKIEFCNY